jgi:quinol monooxygenase YgiN
MSGQSALAQPRLRLSTDEDTDEKEHRMVTTGLMVRLGAIAGKEQALASFLVDALPLVQDEPETIAWFAIRTGESTFAIVDVFPDQAGRQAHLEGPVAAALSQRASELLAEPPILEHVDVLAAKLPGRSHRR